MRRTVLAAALAFSVAAPSYAQQDWSRVEQALGRPGQAQPDGTYKFSFPRSDLTANVDGVEIKPALALGGWDGMEEEDEMRPLVGLELNLPLQRARRAAALDEAKASLEQARSEQRALGDQVQLAVERALERLAEGHHALEIFRDHTLPAARDRVTSARVAFETGQRDFSTVIDAERRLRDAELGYEEAVVEVSRRHAELARATGALPGGPR